jgi:hypothetical protein
MTPLNCNQCLRKLLSENKIKEVLNPPFEYIEAALRQDYVKLAPEQGAQISLEQLIAFVGENPQFIKYIMRDIEPSFRKAISDFAPQAKKMLADALQTKVGILSLSETIEHSLLWAHYAASHKGFAIEFNTEHKFFNRRRFNNDEYFIYERLGMLIDLVSDVHYSILMVMTCSLQKKHLGHMKLSGEFLPSLKRLTVFYKLKMM